MDYTLWFELVLLLLLIAKSEERNSKTIWNISHNFIITLQGKDKQAAAAWNSG